ncbi:MAG TPA: hypothetical protein VFK05_04460 [Polyangiaceae bacterium]|nr:hypothetical protein [Polyangiaceae bacterium]
MHLERLATATHERRAWLRLTAFLATTFVGCRNDSEEHEAEVTPGEDLMQEHGVLERVLLVYDEAARRIDAGDRVDFSIVAKGADIVSRFIEEYHERSEEHFVFPRL